MLRFKDKSALVPILRPHLWRIWLLSGLAVLQSVLQVVMALIFRYVIDAVLSGCEVAFLSPLMIGELGGKLEQEAQSEMLAEQGRGAVARPAAEEKQQRVGPVKQKQVRCRTPLCQARREPPCGQI